MYLVESKQSNDQSLIYVFERTNGKKKIREIKSFEPYFYVEEKENINAISEIVSVKKGYISITGEKLKKIITRTSKDIIKIKGLFEKTYEADILFSSRYIIDNYDDIKKEELRIQYLDIETDGIPNIVEGNKAITSISCYDNFLKKTYTWVLINEEVEVGDPKQLEEELNNIENVYYFKDEKELLKTFIEFQKNTLTDIIAGWNVEKFDLRYIINRCMFLEIDYNKLSPINEVYIDPKYDDVTIKGVVIIDLLRAERKLARSEMESYSLNFVANKLLGEEKIFLEKEHAQMWREDIIKFVKYNRKDVDLTRRIDEKENLIDYFDEVRRLAKCQFKNIFNNSIVLDCYILHKCKNKFILPSKIKRVEEGKYKGAFVLHPKKGIHNNFVALDVKSLYPSIMLSFNMGIDTIYDTENGFSFINRKEKISILAGIIEELFLERRKYKKLFDETKNKIYDSKQYAIKVLTNSIYGAIGFSGFRLYDRRIASEITKIGRKLIMWTKNKLEKMGYEVIYMDTDSAFYKSHETTEEKIKEEAIYLRDEINRSYTDFVEQYNLTEHYFLIEYDKSAPKILFTDKKKRYAYIDFDNKLKITGFESKRSDYPAFARKLQKKILREILSGKTKEELIEYLKNETIKVRNREYPDDEIGFPQGIQKEFKDYVTTNPLIEGAKYSNKYLKTNFKMGDKPKWLYIKRTPLKLPDTTSLTFIDRLPSGFEPDWDKICNRIFKMNLERIWESAGFEEFPELYNKNQTLDGWFK